MRLAENLIDRPIRPLAGATVCSRSSKGRKKSELESQREGSQKNPQSFENGQVALNGQIAFGSLPVFVLGVLKCMDVLKGPLGHG